METRNDEFTKKGQNISAGEILPLLDQLSIVIKSIIKQIKKRTYKLALEEIGSTIYIVAKIDSTTAEINITLEYLQEDLQYAFYMLELSAVKKSRKTLKRILKALKKARAAIIREDTNKNLIKQLSDKIEKVIEEGNESCYVKGGVFLINILFNDIAEYGKDLIEAGSYREAQDGFVIISNELRRLRSDGIGDVRLEYYIEMVQTASHNLRLLEYTKAKKNTYRILKTLNKQMARIRSVQVKAARKEEAAERKRLARKETAERKSLEQANPKKSWGIGKTIGIGFLAMYANQRRKDEKREEERRRETENRRHEAAMRR